MSKFTIEESRWIKRLQKLMASQPPELRLYVIDGDEITICKHGVSSNILAEEAFAEVCPIGTGARLNDLHDMWNNVDRKV